jgi:predicted CXXCH cytochrome family protein
MRDLLTSTILLVGLLVSSLAAPRPAQALLASHECSFCHDFHGAPGIDGLLNQVSSELVCLSCHSVSIGSTSAAVVHNPRGLSSSQSGYITCRECHNPHDNIAGNLKLIGYSYDPQNPSVSIADPSIRVELLSTSGPPVYNAVIFASSSDFNRPDSQGACEACHDPYHNEGKDCTTCHAHDAGFPAPDCTAVGCHDGAGTGALAIGVDSSHSTNTLFASKGVTFSCGDCHSGHQSGTLQIPNNTSVGILYNSAGHNGITLGSGIATGASEAEICWNCHLTYGVSEWGTNSGGGYDYGSLHSSAGDSTPSPGNHLNWTTGFWKSAGFAYKNGPLSSRPVDGNANPGSNSAGRGSSSIHATGGTVGTQSNTLSQVRCSYCHDVHDTMGPSGKPFLRGTWTPSAYPEDGAPRSGDNWADASPFSAGDNLPRASISENGAGGFQIDQNNASVDHSGYSYATDDSLCALCHSTDGSSTGFVGSYPLHRNIIRGFSNDTVSTARNIFKRSQRSTANLRTDPWMAYFGITDYYNSYWMGGFREESAGNPIRDTGIVPAVDGQARAYGNYSWGVTVDDATIDSNFHDFTCSKCHGPHASRLPRLMISNCLDVQRNSWDDDYKSGATPGNTTWGNWPNLTPSSGSEGHQEIAYANTAQNCHRYFPAQSGSGSGAYQGGGWNSVTPW